METITIPKDEYLDLIKLYQIITQKIEKIKQFEVIENKQKVINTLKYCGVLSLTKDALLIQKQLRDEWE